MKPHENRLLGPFKRILQLIARTSPGATTLRVWLHRWRGVAIGKGVWIGYDAIIETSSPHLVEIQDNVVVGIRATIIAHFHEVRGVKIERDAFIGPGVIIMPGVTIGHGAVVTAGSVVTQSVPPMTIAQGNPAKPVARVTVLLNDKVTLREFSKGMRPLG